MRGPRWDFTRDRAAHDRLCEVDACWGSVTSSLTISNPGLRGHDRPFHPQKRNVLASLRGGQTLRNTRANSVMENYLRSLKRSSAGGRYDGCRMRCTRVPPCGNEYARQPTGPDFSSQGLARLALTPTVGTLQSSPPDSDLRHFESAPYAGLPYQNRRSFASVIHDRPNRRGAASRVAGSR